MTVQPGFPRTYPTPPSWLRRLVQCETRINAFLSEQPCIADCLSASDFQRQLQHFWDSAQTDGSASLKRSAQWAQLLAAQMKLIAEQSDLPEEARRLVERCFAEQQSPGPKTTRGFRLAIPQAGRSGLTPLCGLLVLAQDVSTELVSIQGVVVLAELGQPWQSFACGAELGRYLRRTFADAAGRERLLLSLPFEHQAFVRTYANVEDFDLSKLSLAARPLVEPVFDSLARLLIARQRRDVSYQIRTNRKGRLPVVNDLDRVADLQARCSVESLIARYQNPAATAYGEMARRTLQAMPDLHAQGHQYMRSQVERLTGQRINPDLIYLHYFAGAESSAQTFSGWQHIGQPVRSLTLSQLALANFTAGDEGSWPGDLDSYAGIYTEGPGSAHGYGVHNEFRLLPSRLMALGWTADFYSRYRAVLESFWKDHGSDYRALLKGRFIATCRAECRQGRLSRTDYQALVAFAGLGLDLMSSVTLAQLRTHHLQSGAGSVRNFDLYGYGSTDILHFVLGNKRQFLYIPALDNASLVGFDSAEQLRSWVVDQAKDGTARAALAAHFSLYLRQDGNTFSGVDSALSGLAEGRWRPAGTVDRNDLPIATDLFDQLLVQIQARHRRDADTLTTSNGELNEQLWIGAVSAFSQVALPMVPVGWPVGLASALAGVALLGLGIDQTLNADTLAARRQGAWTAFFATLDMLFSAGGEPLAGDDPFALSAPAVIEQPYSVPAQILDAHTVDADGVYRVDNTAWYVRMGNQVYRIAVTSVDHQVQVIRPQGETTDALFFLRRVGTSEQWQRLGISGGRPPVGAPWVRQYVRYETFPGLTHKVLTAVIDGTRQVVNYDLLSNGFCVVVKNESSGAWDYLDRRLYRVNADGMHVQAHYTRSTPAERMATLQALDIDVQFPMDFSLLESPGKTEIPAHFYCIWIGNLPIKRELIDLLEANAIHAGKGQRPYALTLYLSSENTAVFKDNEAALKLHAPSVDVVELERSAFYQGFRSSRYFEQYRAAVDGNAGVGRNFASATDVLRYPLLKFHGGLYLDIDDVLKGAWGETEVGADATGLVLNSPVNNFTLNMDQSFNNSCFGSHPDNPTLEAISSRSYERYLQAKTVYSDPRPIAGTAPDAVFSEYMQKISYLTGPGVFNDVIDELLPDMRRVKQLFRLRWRPVILPKWLEQEIDQALAQSLPLGGLVDTGAEHSWAFTR